MHDFTLPGHKGIMSPVNVTPLRKPNASAISRLLAKAGYARYETEASSMRNATYYSPGFEVLGPRQSWEENLITDADRDAGFVTVQRQTLDTHRQEKDDRPNSQKVSEDTAAYADVLRASDYVTKIRVRGSSEFLVVTGRL